MRTLRIALILLLLPVSILAQKNQTHFLFRDPDLPLEDRVNDLVSHLTLEEKISQLVYQAPAIDRLGIFPHEHITRHVIADYHPSPVKQLGSHN